MPRRLSLPSMTEPNSMEDATEYTSAYGDSQSEPDFTGRQDSTDELDETSSQTVTDAARGLMRLIQESDGTEIFTAPASV
jgi:hypothetical protein